MRPYTIFVDLDGTLVQHNYQPETKPDMFLPGALETLRRWSMDGHRIIVTTARSREDSRKAMSIIWMNTPNGCDLVCNCTTGVRVLINDRSPEGHDKAFAINVNRDEGIHGVVLE